jgi:uncharacterized membrane protein
MNLYYALGERQMGPIGQSELRDLIKRREVNAQTLVWQPGMADWEKLGTFLRRKKQGSGASPKTAAAMPQFRCAECGQTYRQEAMVKLDGVWVCAGCKPIVLQKIKEGVPTRIGMDLSNYGSLDKGLQGNYTLDVFAIIGEAWRLNRGSKFIIIVAYVLVMVISGIAQQVIALPLSALIGILAVVFQAFLGGAESSFLLIAMTMMTGLFMGVLSMMIQAPLWVGIEMIGVRRSVGLPIAIRHVFEYFKQFFPLAITWLLMSILILVGFLFFIIPGIYLMIGLFLALQLVVDKKLGPWQAVKTSIRAIHHKWFQVFFLTLLLGGLLMLGALPFLIGLIWTGPLFIIAKGILYRDIFGCNLRE